MSFCTYNVILRVAECYEWLASDLATLITYWIIQMQYYYSNYNAHIVIKHTCVNIHSVFVVYKIINITHITLHSEIYTVYFTLYNVHCILYSVHCYTVQCTLYYVHITLYNTTYTINTVIVYGKLYSVYYILYSVQCTLYSLHYTVI